jgi:hypothetical protein
MASLSEFSMNAFRPLRVLCLHSFRTSGSILERQMNDFSNFGPKLSSSEGFKDLVRFSHVDAPHACSKEAEERMPERLRRILPPPYYEWWNAQKDEATGSVVYEGADETLKMLREYLEAHGPFDGILGFSQGGSLAHLLCLLQQQQQAASPNTSFRFGIFISARASRHTAHADLIQRAKTASPLTIPSLVIFGGKDNEVPADDTRQLIATLDPSKTTQCFLPDGSHRVPILSDENAALCRAFLEARAREQVDFE